MKRNWIERIRYIRLAYQELSKVDQAKAWNNQVVISGIAAGACLLMSALNIMQRSALMLAFTLGPAVGLFLVYLAARPAKNTPLMKAAFVLLFMFSFTVSTILGGNGGFAALWLTLIPYTMLAIIDLKFGIVVSLYFSILLILLFWTPLRGLLPYQYPITFTTRFPAHYLINFAFALYFAVRMKKYEYEAYLDKKKLEHLATVDASLGVMNRNSYNLYVQGFSPAAYERLSVIYIDVNGLHETNNQYGHEAGDKMLQTVAELCKLQFGAGNIYRLGGDELLLFSTADDAISMQEKAARLSEEIRKSGYSIAFGVACQSAPVHIEELVSQADKNMLENKRRYYVAARRDRRAAIN